MIVKDIMTRSLRAISPDAKISEVASIMCLYRIPGIPVVDEQNKLVGMVSEKDVLANLFPTVDDVMNGEASLEIERMLPRYSSTLNQTVSQLMTNNVITVSPEMHVLKAAARMVNHKFRRIPVADNDGKLVGIMSLGDVHKALFSSHLTEA